MITLAWIENEIEKTLQEKPTAQAVYDLSALVTVRGYLCALNAPEQEPEKKTPTVRMVDYCADLNKCPTLEQVEDALGTIAVNTPEERKRVKEAKIWADILRR